jgi:sulfur-oxidizing protein SoxZ
MASSIKVRTEVEEGITTVRLLIRHPMEAGNRKDPAGQSIPAHYIKELLCEHNGKPVLTTYWGPGISRNPYLSFRTVITAGSSFKATLPVLNATMSLSGLASRINTLSRRLSKN